MTGKSKVVKHYKENLPRDLKELYDKLSRERLMISYQGYALGFIISLCIILYNYFYKVRKMGWFSMVCIVLATSFLTNYFYYILHPKSDWVLNHTNSSEQVKSWLMMYREMQFNYHMGLVLGIIGVGILAVAFRC
jgi:uncharacterized membrane protein YkgB